MSLFNNLPTSELNGGAGVQFDSFLPDVQVNLADGTSVNVTLHQQAVAGTSAQATTIAANGVDAAIQFTAKQPGPAAGGVTISFVNDPTVTAGNETVNYDAAAKTLTFGIQAGVTTANDVMAALNKDPTASTAFSGQAASGGNGDGVISLSDAAITTGPQSSATTPGTLSPDAALEIHRRQRRIERTTTRKSSSWRIHRLARARKPSVTTTAIPTARRWCFRSPKAKRRPMTSSRL